jgi:hypothetical protein
MAAGHTQSAGLNPGIEWDRSAGMDGWVRPGHHR